ncbi:MAG: putative ABC transporter permease [Clostridiaceae bacterium]
MRINDANTPLFRLSTKQNTLDDMDLNLYTLFWALVSFSILGYAVEQTTEFIKFGDFSSRQGMLYGPFSQTWGMGATIAVIFLQRFQKKNIFVLFLFCAVFGGIYEYFASFLQEIIFGTVSWQYFYLAYNFQGRTSLLFCLYWGIAGVAIIKYFYPLLCRQLKKISHKKLLTVTLIVFVLISIDAFLSTAAAIRYNERHLNIPPTTKFQMFIDENYPDSFMKNIYPNSYFKD